MNPGRDAALNYASLGYAVFPCQPIIEATDGTFTCGCGGKTPGCSPGKHPLPKFAPKGVRSATTNPAVIAEWPDEFNIGLAATKRFICVDIDLPEVAQKLLADKDWLEEHVVTHSGREGGGCHIWVLVGEDTVSGDLRDRKTGDKVGELRCDGQYAIVPPSRHYTGRYYTPLGYSITSLPLDREPDYDGDGWAFAREILERVGVELVAHKVRGTATRVELPEGGIPEVELTEDALGFEPNTNIVGMQRPTSLTEADRSGSLWGFAKDVARAASLAGADIDPVTLAGVLKYKDRHWEHPDGAKYAGRNDAGDGNFLVTALRAIDEIEAEKQKTLYDQDPVNYEPDGSRPQFYWDGFWLCWQRARSVVRICNFDIQLVETITRWIGEDASPTQESRIVITLQNGIRKELPVKTYADQRELITAIRGVDQNVIIEDAPLHNAMVFHSNRITPVPNRVAYSLPGWLPGQDAFLLPVGLITADGFSDSVKWEPTADDMTVSWVKPYGEGMAPCSPEELERRVKILLSLAPAKVLYPVLMQVLVAPFSSLALREPAVVHVQGRTQVGKTSLVRSVMSIWGPFADKQIAPGVSWTSTAHGIRLLLGAARDLPLLVDDYKQANARDMLNLIQQYADRTERVSAWGKVPPARSVLLSTGEDIWGGQESSLARTILTHMSEQSDTRFFRWIVDHAKTGEMASIGYHWLVWLCGKGKERLKEIWASAGSAAVERSHAWADSGHQRMVDTAAGLLAVDTIFRQFVAETEPNLAAFFEGWAEAGALSIMESLSDQARESASYGPWETINELLNFWIDNSDGWFRGRVADEPSWGFEGDLLGWCEADNLYTTRSHLWGRYLKEVRSRGEQASFSWAQLKKQLIDLGAEEVSARMVGKPVYCLRIPRALIHMDESTGTEQLDLLWGEDEGSESEERDL